MSAAGAARRGPRLTIGQVLKRLTDDFPGVSISKIRFLEAEGLVQPERTPSGYRKFTEDDVERLRYVLRAQRDHYLPLKVIREHLDAMDRGLAPPALASETPSVPEPSPEPQVETQAVRADLRLSRAELLSNAGLSDEQLSQLEDFQMVAPREGTTYYDRTALEVARSVGAFARYGLEPRHLRLFKTAADREVGLVEQVLAPHRRRRPGAADEPEQMAEGLVDAALRLHTALVRAAASRTP